MSVIALERYWAGQPLTPEEEEFVQRMLPYLPVIEQVVEEELDREDELEAG